MVDKFVKQDEVTIEECNYYAGKIVSRTRGYVTDTANFWKWKNITLEHHTDREFKHDFDNFLEGCTSFCVILRRTTKLNSWKFKIVKLGS